MSGSSLSTTIDSILLGKAVKFGPNEELSAIGKLPVTGLQGITKSGFIGDEQADKRVHGGKDKAIHHFPVEHYQNLKQTYPDITFDIGGFGENLSSSGITEGDVCLGDVFTLGSAVIELSQTRQPCWKLNHRFQIRNLARTIQTHQWTGWYYRVLEEGEVSPGDRLTLINRPYGDFNLLEIMDVLYRDRMNIEKIQILLALPILPIRWRKTLEDRIANGKTEDDSKRLNPPLSRNN